MIEIRREGERETERSNKSKEQRKLARCQVRYNTTTGSQVVGPNFDTRVHKQQCDIEGEAVAVTASARGKTAALQVMVAELGEIFQVSGHGRPWQKELCYI